MARAVSASSRGAVAEPVGDAVRQLANAGSVARGVCSIDDQGYLTGITERTRIEKEGADGKYTENGVDWTCLPGDTTVSMNFWGFTPSILDELAERFPRFLAGIGANPLKAEFFLPSVVNELLAEGKVRVKVIPTAEKWFGVTNRQDRAYVQEALQRLVQQGIYPQNLWG